MPPPEWQAHVESSKVANREGSGQKQVPSPPELSPHSSVPVTRYGGQIFDG